MWKPLAFALLCSLGVPAVAAPSDICSESTETSDVHLVLSLDSDHTVFEAGEVVPLSLSFTATGKGHYRASNQSYDRSGRLDIDRFCLSPEAPDPLLTYFQFGFFGGGLFSYEELGATPLLLHADLNEFAALAPGRYRLYAVSSRVSRPRQAHETSPFDEVSLVVRSNTVDFEVKPADRRWQSGRLQQVLQVLAAAPAVERVLNEDQAAKVPIYHAARQLRFLNTRESTQQLARIFNGRDSEQLRAWDFAFGLYGSPYRQLVIDSMHAEIARPDHPITQDYLALLAGLEISADPAWDAPSTSKESPRSHAEEEAAQQAMNDFWKRRQAHEAKLAQDLALETLAAFPRKTGRARTLTALGLLMGKRLDASETESLRSAIIAGWKEIPTQMQESLVENWWSAIAGPDMLPVLRGLVPAPPPPPARFYSTMLRDAALKRIYEIDPAIVIPLILRDLQDPRTEPSLSLIKLLPPEDIALSLQPAVDRITHNSGRNLDYELLDRYGNASVLALMQAAFEQNLGKESCAPQSAMLRYFLRVAPAYGADQVANALEARQTTRCFASLLLDLGDRLPPAEESAINALNDPEMDVQLDASIALQHWGSKAAEAHLWERMQRFHDEWASRPDELLNLPLDNNARSRAAALEQNLVNAVAGGAGWLSTPERLIRLRDLAVTDRQRHQIQLWLDSWKEGRPRIDPNWNQDQDPTFGILQSSNLTATQLTAKLAQFPSGTTVEWQFWPPGQISPPVSIDKQDAAFDIQRAAAAEHGVILVKIDHP